MLKSSDCISKCLRTNTQQTSAFFPAHYSFQAILLCIVLVTFIASNAARLKPRERERSYQTKQQPIREVNSSSNDNGGDTSPPHHSAATTTSLLLPNNITSILATITTPHTNLSPHRQKVHLPATQCHAQTSRLALTRSRRSIYHQLHPPRATLTPPTIVHTHPRKRSAHTPHNLHTPSTLLR